MYRIVWEFDARPEQLEQFEQVYGPEGLWAKFFRNSDQYVGTELFRSVGQPTRFITLDSWRSRAAYESFRKNYAAEYAQLDEWCERMTAHERTLGVSDDGKD
ncbi:MAG TPA: antibiotic biosynthesis monooxygenase [Steroidobacteraceae bacterium]|nr:antibiotic biosynthesis monooxygenase [Steroidobacteraceae bacterium]